MGAFTAYSLYTAVFLVAGYLIYSLLMAQDKQIAFNRIIILSIYAIAFIAYPLGSVLPELLSHGTISGDGLISVGEISATLRNPGKPAIWPRILVLTYFGGMLVTLIFTLISFLRLTVLIRKGEKSVQDGYILVLVRSVTIAPFSWNRYIIMNPDKDDKTVNMIISHEKAHIRHRHWIDLIIVQCLCIIQWFNPAAWLLHAELKNVHEYQADDSVLSSGIDARNYQLLLIKKAVGSRFHSIANSLNHSNLKKRITMMYNRNSSSRRRLRVLALLPALAVALTVTNIPAVASVLSTTGSTNFRTSGPQTETVTESKVTEKAADEQIVHEPDVLAKFPGGEGAMWKFMADNMHYPEEMVKSQIQGRVVITFTVRTDGTLSDFEVVRSVCPEADAEALRVIKMMPKWTPGMKDGKPVAITYTIPVNFKLN